ncbi:MAG: hypothetical protein Q4G02_02500 [bacterium]|nr:hypothetical protein [bacterium]
MRVDGSIGFISLVQQVQNKNGTIIKANSWPDLQEQLAINEKAVAVYQTFDKDSGHIQSYIEDLDENLFGQLQYHLNDKVFIYGFYAMPKELA